VELESDKISDRATNGGALPEVQEVGERSALGLHHPPWVETVSSPQGLEDHTGEGSPVTEKASSSNREVQHLVNSAEDETVSSSVLNLPAQTNSQGPSHENHHHPEERPKPRLRPEAEEEMRWLAREEERIAARKAELLKSTL